MAVRMFICEQEQANEQNFLIECYVKVLDNAWVVELKGRSLNFPLLILSIDFPYQKKVFRGTL